MMIRIAGSGGCANVREPPPIYINEVFCQFSIVDRFYCEKINGRLK